MSVNAVWRRTRAGAAGGVTLVGVQAHELAAQRRQVGVVGRRAHAHRARAAAEQVAQPALQT